MSVELSFGMHKGMTVEWVVLNNPEYVRWMIVEGADKVHLKGADREHFLAIADKAEHLKPRSLCQACGKVMATRMGVIPAEKGWGHKTCFRCDDCEFDEGTHVAETVSLLFWPFMRSGDFKGSGKVRDAVLAACLESRLPTATQGQMEAFFNNSDRFTVKLKEAA